MTNTIYKKTAFLVLLFFVLASLTACGGSSVEKTNQEQSSEATETGSSNYPDDHITWLIPFSAGGATDIFARQVGRIFNMTEISGATFVYENQGGGGGQVGLGMAINQRVGDNYTLIPVTSTYCVLPHIQGQKYSYKDLTIIAKLCSDYNIIYVNSKSNYQTMEDLINAGKEKELVCATSGVGGTSQIIAEMIKKETGLQFRAVPYNGSGELNTAILGNQADFSVNNPNEILEYIKSGDFKALAVTSEERLEGFPDVPTLKELGINIVHKTSRGIGMPSGVSDEVKNYWIEKCKELYNDEVFKKEYLDSFMLTPEFLPGDEYKAELDAEFESSKIILSELGLAAD